MGFQWEFFGIWRCLGFGVFCVFILRGNALEIFEMWRVKRDFGIWLFVLKLGDV